MAQLDNQNGIIEIPAELLESIKNAATFEDVKNVWDSLKEISSFDQASYSEWSQVDQEVKGTLDWNIYAISHCLGKNKKSVACDNFAKIIWGEDNNIDGDCLAELDSAGIPREFVLHTVRIAATKSLELSLKNNPISPVEQVLDLDGFSWANKKLAELSNERKAQEERDKEDEKAHIEAQKNVVIGCLQTSMNQPDFVLDGKRVDLLRRDFQSKLYVWKAFSDSFLEHANIRKFLSEYGSREITPEIFEASKKFVMKLLKLQKDLMESFHHLFHLKS